MDTLTKLYKENFNIDTLELLKAFNNNLNTITFNLTKHGIDRLKTRFNDIESLFYFLKDLHLKHINIIEAYFIGEYIEKAVYKIEYNNKDLILVLTKNKNIITAFIKGE